MPRGKIISVEDVGSVWQVFYRQGNGEIESVVFDWRQFADFYEETSGRSFYKDYKFGCGRERIKNYFLGKILEVEGKGFEKRVRIEDF